jgi:hypothetical protein
LIEGSASKPELATFSWMPALALSRANDLDVGITLKIGYMPGIPEIYCLKIAHLAAQIGIRPKHQVCAGADMP